MTDADDINQATTLFTAGRYAEAEELCASLAVRMPNNSRLFYLYGVSCFQNGHLEKAAVQFRQASLLNPKDFDSLFNYAVACWDLRRYQESIESYETLLTKAPHYIKALPNLAQAYMKMGRYEEGVATFHKALACNPQDFKTAALLMEFQCLYLPTADRIEHCQTALSRAGLSDSHRHTALIYRAAAEWVMQNVEAVEHSLAAAAAVKAVQGDQGYINMVIYRNFLARLVAYRKENPALYSGDGEALYLTGDSHSLSYAGLSVRMNDRDCKIHSHLIMGTQAAHIGSAGPDTKREALSRYMQSLPEHSNLLCAFGEIDCRVNYGILPYWQKHGGDLETITAGVIERYVAFITKMAMRKSISLFFLSVPAPHPMSGDRRDVVALFNKYLAKYVSESGHHYVDLYMPTRLPTMEMYIDSYHLKPEILESALQDLQRTGVFKKRQSLYL